MSLGFFLIKKNTSLLFDDSDKKNTKDKKIYSLLKQFFLGELVWKRKKKEEPTFFHARKKKHQKMDMNALLKQSEEEERKKTPQQRLREKCRNGKQRQQHSTSMPNAQQLNQLAQRPPTRELKKKAGKHLAPDEFLLMQHIWNKDKKKPSAPETTKTVQTSTETSPTTVIDAITGKPRPTCVMHLKTTRNKTIS